MTEGSVKIDGKSYPLYCVQTLVVGSGAAGLNAAASLFKAGVKDVAIITEGKLMGTSYNTGSDKQTYYKLTMCSDEPDSVRQMASSLFEGGAVDGDLALCEAALSARSFFHLVDLGVPFPHNANGEYVGYKTDHDPFRRGTSAGPLTSKYMTEHLWEEVERYGIPVFNGYQVVEILTHQDGDQKKACGLVVMNAKAQHIDELYTVFSATNIIYATGGEAGMYATSVYPVSQTGGMGTALRIGARAKNLTESQYGIASIQFRWNLSGTYQQVIPRYVSTDAQGNDPHEFLDEFFESPQNMLHAIFLKGYQWPFDPRKIAHNGSSLIDILVYRENVLKGRRVFLDYLHNPSCAEKDGHFASDLLHPEAYEYLKNSGGLQQTPIERLKNMNPAAIELYRSHGIDLNQEMLEIAVCAQHGNGGLAGNCWWESNIKHLFPVGEVNGSHGVYRPGGSALNAGQVGGVRAAEYISHCYMEPALSGRMLEELCGEQIAASIRFGQTALERKGQPLQLKEEHKILGARMTHYGAHIRSAEGVKTALQENREQMDHFVSGAIDSMKELRRYYRIRDLLVSQQCYLEAIADYIAQGGQSRGSYLIYDAAGDMPAEGLPESFRFGLANTEFSGKVQEVEYHPNGSQIRWRPVRPIPQDDSWFEAVWKKYREGQYFEGQEEEQ